MPYLCFVHTILDRRAVLASLPFFRRDDIASFGRDLGDFIWGSVGEHMLSGVTVPSPIRFSGERPSLDASWHHLVSFQGDCEKSGWGGSCDARRELKELVRRPGKPESRIVYRDTANDGVDTSRATFNTLLMKLDVLARRPWSWTLVASICCSCLREPTSRSTEPDDSERCRTRRGPATTRCQAVRRSSCRPRITKVE
jgi:hypothetical protein